MPTGSLRNVSALLLGSCLLLTSFGCGGGDRPTLVAASGVLTLDGKPVEGASISILSVEGGRPSAAISDAEGRFVLNSYPDAIGVPAGEYKVSVVKISGPGADALAGEGGGPAKGEGDSNEDGEDYEDGSDGLSTLGGDDNSSQKLKINYDVPQRYESAETSGLTLTVPEDGSDELKLDLSS